MPAATLQHDNLAQAKISQTFEHTRPLTVCRFSPCGQFVFAGGQDETVIRWERSTGAKTALSGHASWVQAMAVEAAPRRLWTADFHGALLGWQYDAPQPQPIWKNTAAHRGWIQALAASGGRVYSAGNDLAIRCWAPEDSAQPLWELTDHQRYVFSLAVDPLGKTLASGDLAGQVHHWDLENRQKIRTFDCSLLHTRGDDFLADVGGVRSLAFSADGAQLACGGMSDAKSNAFCPGNPAVLVFEVSTGKLLRTLRPTHTSDGPIKGLAYLPDGTLAAHAEHLNGQSSLEFWRPEEEKPFHVIKRESAYCLEVNSEATHLAAATFKPEGRGGNGRHSTPAEYAPHHGEIAIFSLG